jgi:DNA-binding IclR family transcriptional regulator
MFEAIRGDDKELRVLTYYATFCQHEGKEPDIARLAATSHLPQDTTQDILARLASKGWLDKVKDYTA